MDRALREVWPTVIDPVAAMEEIRATGLLRRLREINTPQGPWVHVDGQDAMLLCSNDYLGLAGDPRLAEAAARAAHDWGAGAGASRLVSGNMTPHRRLEERLAAFKGTQACVLFGSGYLANTGVLSALAGPGEVLLSDALNHASIVDGCRLAGAQTIVYPHSDLDALADGLARAGRRATTIVTDAVFSMDGDIARLTEIVELARRHGARVVVDEAHATGVVGPGGRGLVAALGLEEEVDIVVGTLGKALGSYGAFACCNAAMAEFLINRARTLIFSTALPPPAVGAALEGLRILREEPTIVDRLWRNAHTLRVALVAEGFPVAPGDMPIVPLVVGEPEAAMALCEEALRHGVFAQAIRPPTVAQGTSRLRAVAMASHSEEDLRTAALVLGAAAQRTGLCPAASQQY